MNEQRDSFSDETRQAQTLEDDSTRGVNDTDGIGAGKKTGLYGCGFLILAVVIIFIVLVLTGIYNPFEGTEGVGP
jgi:4-hydroxybenzoate polyprenyltransferase